MKIFANALALSILLALLAACGDESSSSVSPEPRQCEEQSDDCNDVSSSSEKISKNSSSSQKSADKGKSSSSVEKSKSSSSSKKDENSSSSVEKAKESSSSVKPSSSDAKSSSSEEVKQSSSSVVPSSSANSSSSAKAVMGGPCEKNGLKKIIGGVHAECVDGIWVPYVAPSSSSTPKSSSSRGYEALPYVPFNSSLSYGEFTDTRDGKKYATIDIDNKYGPDSVRLAFTVFAQNLKYHDKMVLGAEEQDDDTKVEMYCYNDSVEYCNDWWGGLYQWAELMDLPYDCNNKSCAELVDPDGDGFHQGICPDGWHVMTRKEMLAASYTTGGSKYLDDRMSTLASEISYANGFGSNTSGMSFLAAGYRNGEKKLFDFLSEVALVAFAEENALIELNSRVGGVSNVTSLESTTPKIDGVSVRCVKDY